MSSKSDAYSDIVLNLATTTDLGGVLTSITTTPATTVINETKSIRLYTTAPDESTAGTELTATNGSTGDDNYTRTAVTSGVTWALAHEDVNGGQGKMITNTGVIDLYTASATAPGTCVIRGWAIVGDTTDTIFYYVGGLTVQPNANDDVKFSDGALKVIEN